ncbi:uncharacterized protein LOC120521987 [Polypterus senegalus]|uniref:uncharacterized protein LOC120521987 n=1 Tax=Polypterus senegalus TaxID=55291 RepID=UPI001966A2D6|nr:uncharacterized protein LOC120521987 [Polypterus senegalus]
MNYKDRNDRFVDFLSDCLDRISSMRFLDGFNERTFWAMYHLFQNYKEVKGHDSLPHIISLFSPFPNDVPLTDIERIYESDFSFLRQYHQYKTRVSQHKEALQQLRQFIFRSILEAARENRISYTWYYKCIVDCGNQEDFNEALRLTCSIVNVNPNWTKETLNRMKKFIKCSSSKVDIFPDYSDRNKTFLLFLLRCLDWISSIRK